MLTFIKNFIYVLKVLKTGTHTVALYKIQQAIWDFAKKVHEEKEPMLTRIAIMDFSTGEELGDGISLWAGVGDANPIERCKQLRAQNSKMKQLLAKCTERIKEDTEDALLMDIILTLKTFE
jgi:hypothetical protein